ncbi:MAG: hypothetical protein R2789_05485 [Microthrixaceae bacterium]
MNQVGAQDELVFDGGSMALAPDEVLGRAARDSSRTFWCSTCRWGRTDHHAAL